MRRTPSRAGFPRRSRPVVNGNKKPAGR
jgi:hypothetical protein